MPPKKATAAASQKKVAGTTPQHASYKDMIKEAILNLKERNGSSRQALKKYVHANNKITTTSQAAFDSQFNKALKSGVEKGDFTQPKGPSGPVKLAKKEAAARPAAAKPATTKKPTTTKTTTKKASAPKKTTTTKTTTKKAGAPKKTAASKPKANTAKPRKAAAPAPAVVDVPKVLSKTKSGRVTKTPAEAPTIKKSTKKTPVKKAATPKKATPKKADAPLPA